ncbi:MAG: Zn-dependent hydrolase [Cyanobacteria bacterium P01_D01_bin.1]
MSTTISKLLVNRDRLIRSIADLAKVGGLSNGGVQRLAFSENDCRARDVVERWMRLAGMKVRVDPAGNIFGRYAGRFDNAPALATGSHLDTVPNAGHYDGTYGVLAGLEVVRTLRDRKQRLDHPLDIIVFADEERTMVGSKAISGNLSQNAEDYRSAAGEPIEHCLARVGGRWENRAQAKLSPSDIAAFVEVHVEQGPVLEAEQKQIGVVTGIVGQRRYILTVEGRASHAGTTPMSMRADALVAASELVLAINALANQPGDQVATVGQMELSPNVPNTIPETVEMSLDIRDLDNDLLDRLMSQLDAEIARISHATGTKITYVQRLYNYPSPANSHIQNAIAQVCESLSLSHMALPSRASHDAQEMGQITDMGMIFVPSQSGISHAATEYTAPDDCVQGANVLLHTLLKLDQHYRCP